MLLKYVVVEVIIATKVVVCGSTVATDETLVSQALASLLGHLTQLTKAIYHQTWRALPGLDKISNAATTGWVTC